MGTQEMTRYGMREDDFRDLAGLVARVLAAPPAEAGRLAGEVRDLRARFTEMRYCL